MSRQEKMQFELRLERCGSMSDAIALEAIAMFAKGYVSASIATCECFSYRVERIGDQSLRVYGTLSVSSKSKANPWVEVYCVMAGFWSSGCSIQYVGPQAEYLPGNGRLLKRRSVPNSIERPFEDRIPKGNRTKPIPFATMEKILELLTQHSEIETLLQSESITQSVPQIETSSTFVWARHRSGLLIDLDLTISPYRHRIGGIKALHDN